MVHPLQKAVRSRPSPQPHRPALRAVAHRIAVRLRRSGGKIKALPYPKAPVRAPPKPACAHAKALAPPPPRLTWLYGSRDFLSPPSAQPPCLTPPPPHTCCPIPRPTLNPARHLGIRGVRLACRDEQTPNPMPTPLPTRTHPCSARAPSAPPPPGPTTARRPCGGPRGPGWSARCRQTGTAPAGRREYCERRGYIRPLPAHKSHWLQGAWVAGQHPAGRSVISSSPGA